VAEPKKGWLDIVKSSYVWKSMFRHEYQDTYRNGCFRFRPTCSCILHRPRSRRHALRLRFHLVHGRITFCFPHPSPSPASS